MRQLGCSITFLAPFMQNFLIAAMSTPNLVDGQPCAALAAMGLQHQAHQVDVGHVAHGFQFSSAVYTLHAPKIAH
jgi:hypothetical protein